MIKSIHCHVHVNSLHTLTPTWLGHWIAGNHTKAVFRLAATLGPCCMSAVCWTCCTVNVKACVYIGLDCYKWYICFVILLRSLCSVWYSADIRFVCFVNILLKFIFGIMLESSMHPDSSVTYMNIHLWQYDSNFKCISTSNLRNERQISTPREMMPMQMVNGTTACTNCSKSAGVKAAEKAQY